MHARLTSAIATALLFASPAIAQPGTGPGPAGTSVILWVVFAVVALVLFFLIIFLLQFLSLYIQAMTSNAHVGMLDMVGMKLRKVDIRTVVINRIRAVKSGMDIPTNMIE